MPAQVKVEVVVDEHGSGFAKLSEIEKKIADINKKGINIKIGTNGQNGQNGFTTIANSANNAAKAVENTGKIISKTEKKINGEVKATSTVYEQAIGERIRVDEKFSKKGTEVTKTYVHNEEAKRKAAEKTQKEVDRAIEAQRKSLQKLEDDMEKEAKEREKKAERARLAAQKEALAEEEAANRKVAAWARAAKIAATAVVVKASKEALSNMKDVDAELANIRKVTGQSAEVIAQLGEQAYDTASKYGVAAKDYLSAATDFAKAGKSNYAALAELAIKTQLAGDVTADTASKFLLAADAAYKMNGDIEKLSLVLDKANELDNNYATSIEKIAEGFPIVANTANMANMSIEELMASLGTITAVTQQTGAKAATALRALILNITGEIGAVVEEEGEEMFTVTVDSVKNMTDALRIYGSEAVKASISLGKVIDPMEAIRSLATAWANGDLTETRLQAILSSMGGKLRTEQLTALVKNFDMVESQLESMKDAAGSADKEILNLLSTWERKLNQLSNFWTKFVSHMLDVNAIKDGIDLLKNGIELLDQFIRTPVGDATLRIGALVVGFTKLHKIIDVIKKTTFGKTLASGIKTVNDALSKDGGLAGALDTVKTKLTEIDTASLKAWGQVGILTAELAVLGNLINMRGKINDDRFAHMYGRTTADMTGFSGKVSELITSASSSTYKDTSASLTKLLGSYQEIYDKLKKDVTAENSAAFEKEMGFKAEDFISAFDRASQAVELFDKAAVEAEKITLDLGKSAETTGNLYENATDALKHFAEATEQIKSANANAYRSDYQQFLEDWKSGKTDTNAVRAAIDIFIPDEVQRQMGYDMQALGELLAGKMYQGIFNGSLKDSAADFANYLYDTMGKELEGVAKVTQEADGTLSFEYSSAEKLANKLKLPLAVVQSLIKALDEYGVEVEVGWEETEQLAKNIGLIGDNADSSSKNIEAVIRSLSNMEQYADRIDMRKAFNALADAGYIDVSGLSAEELNKKIQAVLDKIDAEKEIELKADEANQELDDLEERLGVIPDKKTLNILAKAYGTKDIWGLAEAINAVQSKTVWVNATTSGTVTGTARAITTVNHSRAGGTRNDPGGMTLVNELGPELISDNGRAYIANGGKPAIVSLGKGAIVLTAEETRQAVGGIRAAASGIPRAGSTSGLTGGYTAHVDTSGEDKSEADIVREEAKALETLAEYYHNMKRHPEEAAAYQEAINKLERIRQWYKANGLTETDTRMAEISNEIFNLEEKMQEAGSHAIDDLEKELKNLDAQITLAEKQGDAQRALQLEKKAQEKIAELIQAYQDAGYADTSDEILRLVNNGYSYTQSSDSRLSEMRKDLIAAIKAMKETQDKANDLAEKQLAVSEARTALENAQNQRTVRIFNPVTGQWEWVANAGDVLEAQNALKSAEETLAKEQQSKELEALEKALGNGTSLSELTIGPALSALISNASVEETNALASALGVLTGGVRTTADTTAKSIFDNVDSHDSVTNYTFNGVNIGQAIAETTTLAQLARMISPLALTGNMPL